MEPNRREPRANPFNVNQLPIDNPLIRTQSDHELTRKKFADQLNKNAQDLKSCEDFGQTDIPKWVFCAENGNFMDPYNLKDRYFYKCLEKAGLRRIRFHDLRHTFATLLLQNGESLAYVKDQLGHSSIRMTVDTYGHLVPGVPDHKQTLTGPGASQAATLAALLAVAPKGRYRGSKTKYKSTSPPTHHST